MVTMMTRLTNGMLPHSWSCHRLLVRPCTHWWAKNISFTATSFFSKLSKTIFFKSRHLQSFWIFCYLNCIHKVLFQNNKLMNVFLTMWYTGLCWPSVLAAVFAHPTDRHTDWRSHIDHPEGTDHQDSDILVETDFSLQWRSRTKVQS